MGLLGEVTEVISSQLKANIKNINIATTDGIFEGNIKLDVFDSEDVKTICKRLKKIPSIKVASRVE